MWNGFIECSFRSPRARPENLKDIKATCPLLVRPDNSDVQSIGFLNQFGESRIGAHNTPRKVSILRVRQLNSVSKLLLWVHIGIGNNNWCRNVDYLCVFVCVWCVCVLPVRHSSDWAVIAEIYPIDHRVERQRPHVDAPRERVACCTQ